MFVLLFACAYRPPAEPPPLAAAQGPLAAVSIPGDRVVLALRAGSAADPPGREGLAALTAATIAAQAGAEVVVEPELVAFRVDADALPALAAAIGAVDEQKIAAARETLAAPETCWDIARAAFDAWVFAGHPYGHAPRGRTSVVPTLTAAEVRGFAAARYVRGSAALGVPEAARLADQALLAPTITRHLTPATLPPVDGRRMLVVEAPIGTSCAAAGHRAARPLSMSERAALAVAQALGEGPVFDRRVQERVVVGMGLQDPVDPAAAAEVSLRFAALATEGLAEDAVARGRTMAGDAYGPAEEAIDLLAARLLPGAGGSLRAALASATGESVTASLAAVIDPGEVRVVVVTPDASAFRSEGRAPEDVQAVMASSEMFR
ncbi:MAG: hypothetical protein ACOZNI_36355 [Myxococcota bacterium]